MPEQHFADTHSPEVEDIVGRAPSWVVRRGTIVLAVLICAALAGAWLIRYPDVVTVPVSLGVTQPPVKVTAISKGYIRKYFISDNTTVKINDLIGTMDDSTHVLRAPASGKWIAVKGNGEYTTGDDVIGMIVPLTFDQDMRVSLPEKTAGKVRTGQRVLIKLNEYPFIEYGMLPAKVTMIAGVPVDSSYPVRITLSDGLQTTRHRTIPGKPGMTGTADIITDNRSILERIFERFATR